MTLRDSVTSVFDDPHRALLPHSALNPVSFALPQSALLPHKALLPQSAFSAFVKTFVGVEKVTEIRG